jgi:hypothetical protein
MSPQTTNPFNLKLAAQRFSLSRAFRYALTPNCNPTTGAPNLTSRQLRKQLLELPIQAAIAGDNLLIPTTGAGEQLIFELLLWNSSAAPIDMALYQGPSASGILLLPISNFPPTTGLTLGFNGNWEQPHFQIDIGQPFVLNLSTAGPVQGMIRYKLMNGTS